MAEPATGSAAAITATTMTTSGMFMLSKIMPAGASFFEFIFGCVFAMAGAAAYQFIEALVSRQVAAEKGVPIADRPVIDRTMLGYAMFGSPLSVAFLMFGIHYFKGTTGFGDASFLQSVAGFMAAGAAGPKIVIKGVATIVSLINSRIGGKTP